MSVQCNFIRSRALVFCLLSYRFSGNKGDPSFSFSRNRWTNNYSLLIPVTSPELKFCRLEGLQRAMNQSPTWRKNPLCVTPLIEHGILISPLASMVADHVSSETNITWSPPASVSQDVTVSLLAYCSTSSGSQGGTDRMFSSLVSLQCILIPRSDAVLERGSWYRPLAHLKGVSGFLLFWIKIQVSQRSLSGSLPSGPAPSLSHRPLSLCCLPSVLLEDFHSCARCMWRVSSYCWERVLHLVSYVTASRSQHRGCFLQEAFLHHPSLD